MPGRQNRNIAFLLILVALSSVAGTSWAGTDPSFDAAIARLKQGQRLHVRTNGSVILRGRFLQAADDSIYLELRFPEEKSLGDPEVRTMFGVNRAQVDEMWAFERHGVRRGLLWAGGTLLAGTALIFAGGGDDLGDAVFITTATALAVPVAFAWGMWGKKETQIYSRD